MPFKKANRQPGIYGISNLLNARIYIGQASDLRVRRCNHFSDLRNGRHINEHLQRAFDKYGEENFQFIVLCYCQDDELTAKEQEWMDRFPADQKYNCGPASHPPFKGISHTESAKEKISSAVSAAMTPEKRQQIREKVLAFWTEEERKAHGDKIRSRGPEYRKKLSEVRKGVKKTKATRKAISDGKKRSVTPEFRERMRQIRLAAIAANPDSMKKTQQSRIGLKHTPESIEKMRKAHLGNTARRDSIAKKKCPTPPPPT